MPTSGQVSARTGPRSPLRAASSASASTRPGRWAAPSGSTAHRGRVAGTSTCTRATAARSRQNQLSGRPSAAGPAMTSSPRRAAAPCSSASWTAMAERAIVDSTQASTLGTSGSSGAAATSACAPSTSPSHATLAASSKPDSRARNRSPDRMLAAWKSPRRRTTWSTRPSSHSMRRRAISSWGSAAALEGPFELVVGSLEVAVRGDGRRSPASG